MLKVVQIARNNRQMKALTGLNIVEFEILLKSFATVLYEHFAGKERKRKVGGGRKGALVGAVDKLFYILFYAKVYPTYDLAGFIFGVNRSRCCNWVKEFMTLVEKAL